MNQINIDSQLTEKDFSAESILLEAIKSFYSIYTQSHMTQMMYADLRASVLPLVKKYLIVSMNNAYKEGLAVFNKEANPCDAFKARIELESKCSAALDTVTGIIERACKGKHYGAVNEYNEEVMSIYYQVIMLANEHYKKLSDPT